MNTTAPTTTTKAQEALANLWEQSWFAQNTPRPEVEETILGGYTVWCETEIYRIDRDGEIFRVYTRSGEKVFLD
jgi:hypothetical protein